MNKHVETPGRTIPMRSESVNFTNGMIVTADDLSAAMAYPVALMQAVNVAVFGCGVVCGFRMGPDPDLCDRPPVPCDPCDPDKDGRMAYGNFIVEIGRGTALDCHGLPVELCKPVRVDLGDDRCGCNRTEGEVCIFIRRFSAPEAPQGDCCGGGGPVQCARLQDYVEIRAFPRNKLPEHACMHPFDDGGDHGCGCGKGGKQDDVSTAAPVGTDTRYPTQAEECACLDDCDDCCCCGEGWILLGCVELCKSGIVVDSFDLSHRKRIKPIDCRCRKVPAGTPVGDDAQEEPQTVLLALESGAPSQQAMEEITKVVGNESRAAMMILAGANTVPKVKIALETLKPQLKTAWGVSTDKAIDDAIERAAEVMRRDTPS